MLIVPAIPVPTFSPKVTIARSAKSYLSVALELDWAIAAIPTTTRPSR